MGITYEDAVKAQAELEEQILADPNVVSVGVIAETDELGEPTGDYVIKVGVISSEVYQNSVSHGDSLIPREYLLHPGKNDQEIKHVRIKVVKTGTIKALSLSNTEKNDFPSAIDDIPVSISSVSPSDQTSRRRPSPGGYSIGHPSVTAGTFGLLLEYEEGIHTGKAFILSNNHVIAANNLAHVGDAIIQPGKHDSGIVGRDTIAFLHRWVPLEYSGVNYVDAAIAEVAGGNDWSNYVSPYVSHIGHPSSLTDAQLGMSVEKTGRTTGYTTGTILSVNQTVKVDYGNIGKLLYRNQICTTSMSKSGDSGSCLFEKTTRRPVGLLFAGDDSETFHNHMKLVLSFLSREHRNRYPSGKIQTFAPDRRLQILQKRSYSTSAIKNSSVKNGVSVRSLGATKYGAAVGCIVATIGIVGSIKNLAAGFKSSDRSRLKTEGILNWTSASCHFFKTERSSKAALVPTESKGWFKGWR